MLRCSSCCHSSAAAWLLAGLASGLASALRGRSATCWLEQPGSWKLEGTARCREACHGASRFVEAENCCRRRRSTSYQHHRPLLVEHPASFATLAPALHSKCLLGLGIGERYTTAGCSSARQLNNTRQHSESYSERLPKLSRAKASATLAHIPASVRCKLSSASIRVSVRWSLSLAYRASDVRSLARRSVAALEAALMQFGIRGQHVEGEFGSSANFPNTVTCRWHVEHDEEIAKWRDDDPQAVKPTTSHPQQHCFCTADALTLL